jgi:glycosyltransferase involved in cell wall biosynthesis
MFERLCRLKIAELCLLPESRFTLRNLLIYRHQLFRPSEGFIVSQAERLQEFRPVYVGRELSGTAPSGATVCTLESARRVDVLRYMLRRDPRPILREVRSLKPVMIHAHFGVEGVYALEVARRLGIPLVTTFHGLDATTSRMGLLRSGHASWFQYLLRRRSLAQSGELFLCVSEFIRERVLRLGFPPEKCLTHYIGVDVEGIAGRTASSHSRDEDAEAVILHVARLVETKGTRYLLEALAQVIASGVDARLIVIGDGPLRSRLEGYARSLGVRDRVLFLGTLPNSTVLDWVCDAAVLAFPSVTAASGAVEGLGMVLLEAAAAGVPAIATRYGGIPEAVVDGRTGVLVEERDVDALADALRMLLTNEGERAAMGAAARDYVARKFDVNRQTAALESLYKKLV